MKKNIVVRKIRKEELKTTYDFLNRKLLKNNTYSILTAKRVHNMFKKYPYFFIDVFLDNKIIGVIGGKRKNAGEATISFLCIDSKFKGKGFGKRLVKEFEKQAIKRKYKAIKLGSLNESVGFYNSLGYKPSILIQIKKKKFNNKIKEKLKKFQIIFINQVNNYKGIEVKCDKTDLSLLKKLKNDFKTKAVQYLFTKKIKSE